MHLQAEFHVYDTTLRDGAQQEGLNLSVADKPATARTLSDLRGAGRTVFLAADDFFGGCDEHRACALLARRTPYEAGREVIALCDANDGMLPPRVSRVVHGVASRARVRVGIHCHHDA